jgi:hypothetical protein
MLNQPAGCLDGLIKRRLEGFLPWWICNQGGPETPTRRSSWFMTPICVLSKETRNAGSRDAHGAAQARVRRRLRVRLRDKA